MEEMLTKFINNIEILILYHLVCLTHMFDFFFNQQQLDIIQFTPNLFSHLLLNGESQSQRDREWSQLGYILGGGREGLKFFSTKISKLWEGRNKKSLNFFQTVSYLSQNVCYKSNIFHGFLNSKVGITISISQRTELFHTFRS